MLLLLHSHIALEWHFQAVVCAIKLKKANMFRFSLFSRGSPTFQNKFRYLGEAYQEPDSKLNIQFFKSDPQLVRYT